MGDWKVEHAEKIRSLHKKGFGSISYKEQIERYSKAQGLKSEFYKGWEIEFMRVPIYRGDEYGGKNYTVIWRVQKLPKYAGDRTSVGRSNWSFGVSGRTKKEAMEQAIDSINSYRDKVY